LVGAGQKKCRAAVVRDAGKKVFDMDQVTPHPVGCNNPRIEYLLKELRCASLRVRLWAGDIDAVGLALKASIITAEQAIEMLDDCPALQFVAPEAPPTPAEEAWISPNWSSAAAEYHADRKGRVS
jgi:hypothetical protein